MIGRPVHIQTALFVEAPFSQNPNGTYITSPVMPSSLSFLSCQYYDDKVIYALVAGCAEALGLSQEAVLKAFGTHFITFAREAGYDMLMRVLGSTLEDFCSGLDRMHRHLSHNLPKLVFPAFWTMVTPDGEGIRLFYSSVRPGLWPMVETIIIEVAKVYYSLEVTVSVAREQALNETSGEYECAFDIRCAEGIDASARARLLRGEAAKSNGVSGSSVDVSALRCPFSGVRLGGLPQTGKGADGLGANLACPAQHAAIAVAAAATDAQSQPSPNSKLLAVSPAVAARAPTAATAAAASPEPDRADLASKLDELCDAGLLTNDECAAKKAQLSVLRDQKGKAAVLNTLPYHMLMSAEDNGSLRVVSVGNELRMLMPSLAWDRQSGQRPPLLAETWGVVYLSHSVSHHSIPAGGWCVSRSASIESDCSHSEADGEAFSPPSTEADEARTNGTRRLRALTLRQLQGAVIRGRDGAAAELMARALLPGASKRLRLMGQVSLLGTREYLFHGVPASLTVDALLSMGLSINNLPRYASSLDLLMAGEQIFRQNEEAKAQFLAQDQAATRATNARLSTALSYLSHEVRNQLAPIEALVRTRGPARRPRSDGEGPEARAVTSDGEYTRLLDERAILHSLSTCSDILNGVLALARINTGHVNPPTSVFQLGALLTATESFAAACAERNGNALETRMSFSHRSAALAPRCVVEAPSHRAVQMLGLDRLYVRGGRTWLTQICSNLVSNAAKFTEQGSVRLTWTIEDDDDEGGNAAGDADAADDGGCGVVALCEGGRGDCRRVRVKFQVADTGCGIRPEHLDIVMQEFGRVRTGSASGAHVSGTGLGLPLAKKMCEALGGQLELQSVFGEGTTITVSVSLEVAPQPPEDAAAARLGPLAGIEEASRAAAFTKLNADILAVDDNSLLMKMYARKAMQAGLSFHACKDGTEAVALARAGKRYGLTLMDKQMPHLCGDAACAEMRRLGYRGLVALVTADTLSPDERGKLLGEYGLDFALIKGESPSWMECIDLYSKGKRRAQLDAAADAADSGGESSSGRSGMKVTRVRSVQASDEESSDDSFAKRLSKSRSSSAL